YNYNGLADLGINFIRRAVEFDPLSVVYLKDLVRCQSHLGNIGEAKQTARRLIEVDGKEPAGYVELFRISMIEDNRHDALVNAKYLMQIDPAKWEPWLQPSLLILDGKRPEGPINSLAILSLLKMENEFLMLLKERLAAYEYGD